MPTDPQSITGRIHSVETFGALDGPGLRYILFLQGCPMRCVYCHNPDALDFFGGEEKTVAAVMADILKYRSFLKQGGVTLSGGEPLAQPEFCTALIAAGRAEGLHMAVDTSGGVALKLCRPAVEAADLLLLDIKAAEEALCRAVSGAGLTHPLAILNVREALKKPVWIRHVVVPGLTLSDRALTALGKLVGRYACVEKAELLPFHKLGEYKWEALGLDYTLRDTPPPTEAEMAHARAVFEAAYRDVRKTQLPSYKHTKAGG